MPGRAWVLMIALWASVPILGAAASADGTSETSPADTKPGSKFFDADDGWLDVSGFLDTAYGFVRSCRRSPSRPSATARPAGSCSLDRFQNRQTAVASGGEVRYLLARRYGLHMGFDVGFGPDGPILYIQFGSAWLRP